MAVHDVVSKHAVADLYQIDLRDDGLRRTDEDQQAIGQGDGGFLLPLTDPVS